MHSRYRFIMVAGLVCAQLAIGRPGFCAVDEDKKAKSLAAYTMGVIYDLKGKMDQSAQEYKKSLDYNDQYAAHLRLGANYARLNRLGDAIDEFEKVLKLDPENVQARYLLALIYSSQQDYDKAAVYYEGILKDFSKDDPQNVDIYNYLGQLYYAKKEYLKAAGQFEKSLSLQPDNADIMYTLGSLYLEINERAKAKQMFGKCVDHQPDNDGCLNSLGYMYAEDGDKLDDAQHLIERALIVDPKNGAYLDSLGWIYFQKGENAKALEYLRQADMQMKDPVIYEHLGDVYFRMQDMVQARKFWKLSLDMLPGQLSVQEKLKMIK